jgi:lysophospholipase L1-like esterase
MRILRKLLTGFGATLVLFLVAELVARAAEPGPFTFVDRSPYLADPVLKQVHRPAWKSHWDGSPYATDDAGRRRSSSPAVAPGGLRVLAVGDSCTFGKGVEERDTWPRQLETRLRAAPDPRRASAVVDNAGVNGYSGRQYAEATRRALAAARYDLVVVGWNANDFDSVVRRANVQAFEQQGLRQAFSDDARDAMGRLALYRLARAWWWHLRREGDWSRARALAAAQPERAAEDQAAFERELVHLDALHAACQAAGARLVMFLFPYESQVLGGLHQDELQQRLAQACQARGIPTFDLAASFRQVAHATAPPMELFLRGDRYHPRAEGYALVAEEVVRALGQ